MLICLVICGSCDRPTRCPALVRTPRPDPHRVRVAAVRASPDGSHPDWARVRRLRRRAPRPTSPRVHEAAATTRTSANASSARRPARSGGCLARSGYCGHARLRVLGLVRRPPDPNPLARHRRLRPRRLPSDSHGKSPRSTASVTCPLTQPQGTRSERHIGARREDVRVPLLTIRDGLPGGTRLERVPSAPSLHGAGRRRVGPRRAMMAAVTPERNARIVERYRAGAPLEEIAAEHGLSAERVRQIARRSGEPGRRTSRGSDQRRAGEAADRQPGQGRAGHWSGLSGPEGRLERVRLERGGRVSRWPARGASGSGWCFAARGVTRW